MYTYLINRNNMDVKTGELYDNLLSYDNIFSGRVVDHVKMERHAYKRIRTCKAWAYDDGMYTYLISYNTVVGMLDRHTGIFYDALRTEYGYTATSAQHIAKFCRDYPVFSVARYVA